MTPDQRPVPRPPLPPSTDRLGEPCPLMGVVLLVGIGFLFGLALGLVMFEMWWRW